MTSLVNQFPDVIAILPAAGIGRRMQTAFPKQYLTINEKTLLEYTIDILLYQPCVIKVIVAINPNDKWFHTLSVATNQRVQVVIGGKIRTDSVMAALRYAQGASWILIHDAVRPCLHKDDLYRLLAKITTCSDIGGILATPVRDTMKRSSMGTQIIDHTVERDNLWHALTPQLFSFKLLIACLEKVLSEGAVITDEASALEYCGYTPLIVQGRSDNIKVTYPEDLELAKFYLSQITHNSHQERI
ncbi:2-C-methyl-D-erythritol 4-phosphate cytidylyltransferase [Candidatus Curculioniphilus buchneri]|uniref:2-C-methyl-D-erythritol 4-phosphate cytidylyltransferase n=1 Tax=Candidatus Curculioniphilus buchneri TaxID=690594 RepID=UPI00376EB6D5